jgi:hypothetical protein
VRLDPTIKFGCLRFVSYFALHLLTYTCIGPILLLPLYILDIGDQSPLSVLLGISKHPFTALEIGLSPFLFGACLAKVIIDKNGF